jgi:hypothetical protein
MLIKSHNIIDFMKVKFIMFVKITIIENKIN